MSLAQSTSRVVMLKVYLSSDHVTAATGKTVAITISKAGGAFGNPNAGATNATEVSSGWYKVTLDTTDTNTLGDLIVRGTAAACDDTERALEVLSATTGGASNLDAAISTRSSHAAADVWAVATRVLTAGTNIALAKGTGVTGFTDLSAAQVNAEVVDALATDTYAEPGQGTPAATASLATKIGFLAKAWRNKKTVTATTFSLFNDDAATVDQKSTISDASGTFTEGEKASGP